MLFQLSYRPINYKRFRQHLLQAHFKKNGWKNFRVCGLGFKLLILKEKDLSFVASEDTVPYPRRDLLTKEVFDYESKDF